MKRMLALLPRAAITPGSGLMLAAKAGLQVLEQVVRKEDQANSIGVPDSWANWKDTRKDLEDEYGPKHMGIDMSSTQELAKFKTEEDNASASIGDIGAILGPIAVQQGISQPHKLSTWEQIPAWAKDQDGHWAFTYTGTIVFIVNEQPVKNVPYSRAGLLQDRYKVTIGDVGAATQAVNGVLVAAIVNGGDEKSVKPDPEFFGKIAKQDRLSLTNPVIVTLEKDEIEVGIVWDSGNPSYHQRIDPGRSGMLIPLDDLVTSGYTTTVSKYVKHPNAAKLTRECIFDDAGQINLAKGDARSIRAESLTLSDDVKAQLLLDEQCAKVQPIKDAEAQEEISKRLSRQWQKTAIIDMQ